MKIGIDKIGFFTSDLYVDMIDLAHARQEDPNKYLIGIGQSKMAVIPRSQDSVTLAANAADKILTDEDKKQIDMVLFGTESGIDNSKSGAEYVANLLGLKPQIRVMEIKQACYGATGALQLAQGYVALHPNSKVLVIGSDIARYGIGTKGEPTQGGGAVAMLISKDPAIIELDPDTTAYAQDVMDFWRPLGQFEAMVDGKFSVNVYLEFFEKVFNEYLEKKQLNVDDFKALLFHLPYTKEGLKAVRLAVKNETEQVAQRLIDEFENVRCYSKLVGNLYTGSLYLGFLSLLENDETLQAGDRLGFYSYGSGAQGEFFSGILQPEFKNRVSHHQLLEVLNARKKLSVTDYENIYSDYIQHEANATVDLSNDKSKFVLAGVKDYQRIYRKQS